MSKTISLLLARVETLAIEKKGLEDKLINSFDRHMDEVRGLRDDVDYYRERGNLASADLRQTQETLRELEALPGFAEFVAAAKKTKEDEWKARFAAARQENFNSVLNMGKLSRGDVLKIRNIWLEFELDSEKRTGKIPAIKETRLLTNAGLKEAKDFCEALAECKAEELEAACVQAETHYQNARNLSAQTNTAN